jgi:tRNA(Arg) A34 adenosine deaminase TadA
MPSLKWSDLELAWQECFCLSWEAFLAGSVPIGAVILDRNGTIISRGRNHIHDQPTDPHQVGLNTLAHAELNALLTLPEMPSDDRHGCSLYTAVEPCPLCMGAIYMTGLRCLYYACHDAHAGSTNLLGTTPYLSRKPIRVVHPQNAAFEAVICALQTEFSTRGFHLHEVLLDRWRQDSPAGVALGEDLQRCGFYEQMQRASLDAPEVFDWLAARVG